ncbi:MAG TPA: phosphotransferase family protein [Candidatus Limnocylindria bacterium]|nr:phosphotransferase family protein [Candidatus Limnocylindria bacterium]
MTQRAADTIPVRPEERLETARLEPYLRAHLPDAAGTLEIRQFGGGHANLTYLLRFGEREYVLRRPPLGPVPPGAHDMRREHRVLATLHAGFPLAPRSLLLCTDHGVIGADFFVMERRHGIALRADVPAPLAAQPDVLRGIGFALIDTLAALHAVDPASVALGDLGKPEGFVARQLDGWIGRWFAALTDDTSPAEPLVDWLREHVPAARRTTLVHNDYKLDNVLLDPVDPMRLTAVLDWDMCTRGEPLMDLGYLLALWTEPHEASGAGDGRMPTWHAGFPSRREAAARYAERSGAALDELPWYVVFNVFRYAAILQQIYLRYTRGQTHDARFVRFGEAANMLTERALTLIDEGVF